MGESPNAEIEITIPLVRQLLLEQHPDLAQLPLGESYEGWDTLSLRLGNSLLVRLPRRALSAEMGAVERIWLPVLSQKWSFHAPVPVRLGVPSRNYPWPWSIVAWFEGATVFEAPLSPAGVADLGRALAEVHKPAPSDVPLNPFRSPPLSERRERLLPRLAECSRLLDNTDQRFDERAALALFDEGAALPPGPLTWSHLDLHGNNLLSSGGRLAAIVDWVDCGGAQPETDLGQALCLVGQAHFDALVRAYLKFGGVLTGGSAATDERLRWGLSKQSTSRIRAEALTYSVFLLAAGGARYAQAGSKSLIELGVQGSRR